MPDVTSEDLRTEGGARATAVAGIPADGLIIVEPFAKWVAQGRKPIIVKSRPYRIAGRPFLFVTKNNALGIIQLSQPREIDVAQFRKLQDQHLIDEATRKKFWPGRRRFWAYRVVRLQLFDKPLQIDRPRGSQVLIRSVKFMGDVVALFDITKADADALDSLRESLRELVPVADRWAKSVLRFLEGPAAAVRVVRSAPDVARRMLATVGGGTPKEGAAFPAALRAVIRTGRQTVRVLRREKGGEIVRRLEKWLEDLEEIDRLIPSLADVENEPVAKAGGDGRDAGAHRHGLQTDVEMTAFDGAHGHVFVLAADVQLPDGTTLEAGDVLQTLSDGAHLHAFLSGPGAAVIPFGEIDETLLPALDDETLHDFLEIARDQDRVAEVEAFEAEVARRGAPSSMRVRRAGEHEHVVRLPNGDEIKTDRDGQHGHALLAESTGYDGPHVHDLPLPGGVILASMAPEEYRRAKAAIGAAPSEGGADA